MGSNRWTEELVQAQEQIYGVQPFTACVPGLSIAAQAIQFGKTKTEAVPVAAQRVA